MLKNQLFVCEAGQDHSVGKYQCFQHVVLGKWDIHMENSEVGPLPNITHKN